MKILFLLLFLSCHAMAGVITPSILVETTAPVLDLGRNGEWAVIATQSTRKAHFEHKSAVAEKSLG